MPGGGEKSREAAEEDRAKMGEEEARPAERADGVHGALPLVAMHGVSVGRCIVAYPRSLPLYRSLRGR